MPTSDDYSTYYDEGLTLGHILGALTVIIPLLALLIFACGPDLIKWTIIQAQEWKSL